MFVFHRSIQEWRDELDMPIPHFGVADEPIRDVNHIYGNSL